MADAIQELEQALADFDERHSPLGKLTRYRNERLARFFSRLALVCSGVLAVGLLVSFKVALGAVAVFLVGEAIESAILLSIPRWLGRGMSVLTARKWTFVGSLIQTLSLCVFIFIAWFFVPRESAIIMCLALLGGSAVNALTAMPLNRQIGLTRLRLFAGLTTCLAAVDIYRFDTFPTYLYFNIFGAGMLLYLIIPFAMRVSRERGKENTAQRRLLAQGLALAKTNETLYEKQQETRRLALVTQRTKDAISLLDPKGNVVWVNEAFVLLTGYSLNDVMGKKSSQFFDCPDECSAATEAINEALQDGSSGKIVSKFIAHDGQEKWLETSYGPVFDDDGMLELLFVIDRDISDIKLREEELEEARLAAEKGERAKSSFLATMSHEIRTPMNGIIGMADLLSKSDLPEADRLYVDTIQSSGESLLTIINDILDFSKLNDGHLAIKPTTFALQACMDEVLNLMRPQVKAKGLTLIVDCQPDLPTAVIGDDGRLRQVLINVIGNAIKFTDKGNVEVRMSGRREGQSLSLAIEIEDSGIGVPDDQAERIFERFAQADTASTRRFGGTGLGLSISRRLVRLMNGDITVRNGDNCGAVFRIMLELGIAKDLPQTAASVDVLDLSVLNGVNVLLAEDNRTNRLVVEKFLQNTPITLTTACNGQEAVQLFAREKPDIVLMDMSMPVMDGLDATRAIRQMNVPQPGIIALTANAFASDREACSAAGMDGFLSKPLRRAHLLQELVRIKTEGLDQRQAEPLAS